MAHEVGLLRSRGRVTALLVAVVLWAASGPTQTGPPAVTAGRAELRAVLLEGLDRGGLPGDLWGGLRREPDPELRVLAVRIMASTADPASLPRLMLFAQDADPRVREAVLIAAGRIGPSAAEIVRPSLAGPSALVRRAAAWAACHMGEALLEPMLGRLRLERDPGVLETALASLWRLPEGRWESAAASFADHVDPLLRRAAAYSLARGSGPLRRSPLRRLVVDPEPVIRATALRGLGDEDGERLLIALGDPDPRVRAAACLRIAAGSGEVGEAAGPRLARLLEAPQPHLAVSAARALGAVSGGEAALGRMLTCDDRWLAAEVLEALGRRGAASAAETATSWLQSNDLWRRRAAARTVGRLAGPEAALRRALEDPEPAVRLAVLESAAEGAVPVALLSARIAADPDPAVRATLVERLAAAGGLTASRLLELARSWRADSAGDARAAALVAAIESGSPQERRSAVALAMADPDPAVVAQVAAAARATGERARVPLREARHPRAWYRELVEWSTREHWLDLTTERGSVRLRLESAATPLSARAVWDLARAGFYDGLTFHRVVPNFVVQGGDPRGDGWGGPGFVVADEPDLAPFDSWRVGIATSGPNTGGCQLFATLLPADHLTGHFVNVAEVTAGREVLEQLRQGDRILEVRTVEEPEAPPLGPQAAGRRSPDPP